MDSSQAPSGNEPTGLLSARLWKERVGERRALSVLPQPKKCSSEAISSSWKVSINNMVRFSRGTKWGRSVRPLRSSTFAIPIAAYALGCLALCPFENGGGSLVFSWFPSWPFVKNIFQSHPTCPRNLLNVCLSSAFVPLWPWLGGGRSSSPRPTYDCQQNTSIQVLRSRICAPRQNRRSNHAPHPSFMPPMTPQLIGKPGEGSAIRA